jgi:hypothetical protein
LHSNCDYTVTSSIDDSNDEDFDVAEYCDLATLSVQDANDDEGLSLPSTLTGRAIVKISQVLEPTVTVEDEHLLLCETCGLFQSEGCLCQREVARYCDHEASFIPDDHTYGVRSTVRKHERTGNALTRKRMRNESEWESKTRKRLRQGGQAYITKRGHQAPSKGVKACKIDHTECRFKCAISITAEGRQKFTMSTGCCLMMISAISILGRRL